MWKQKQKRKKKTLRSKRLQMVRGTNLNNITNEKEINQSGQTVIIDVYCTCCLFVRSFVWDSSKRAFFLNA